MSRYDSRTVAQLHQAHNWTVPSTWSDLAAFAIAHNRMDGMSAVCMPWCSSFYELVYQAMMASYVQVRTKVCPFACR